MARPRRTWTPAETALLGTMSDVDLAERLGISQSSVQFQRALLGLPRFVPSRDWSAIDPLVGTISDRLIGERFGLPKHQIRDRRVDLGIAGAPLDHPSRQWTPDELALLGTMSDVDLAERLGLGDSTVQLRRVQEGIPVYVSERDWTLIDALIRDPALNNQMISDRVGLSDNSIRTRRAALGIPPPTYRRSRPLRPRIHCPTCGKAFLDPDKLDRHLTWHSVRSRTPEDARARRLASGRRTARRARDRKYASLTLGYRCACGRRFPSRYALGSHCGEMPVGSTCRPFAGQVPETLAATRRRRRRRQRRRHYQRAWRSANPTYHATWRADHRDQERERKRRWRRSDRGRASRREYERRTRRSRAQVIEIPVLFRGDPILEAAQRMAGRPWYGNDRYDPTREDAAGEAVLAMLEGRDPREAIHAYNRIEWEWRFHTVEVPENL